jgi:galactokinase
MQVKGPGPIPASSMILTPRSGPLRSPTPGMLTRPAPDGQAGAVPAARAPGRVTLIGDHTDYNGGLSLPMALEMATEITFVPQPGSFLIGVDSDEFPGGHVEIPLEVPLDPFGSKSFAWGTAPLPPEAFLAACLLRLHPPSCGGTITVTSTLPVGAGLSSSAAFSVALLLALSGARRTHEPALAVDLPHAGEPPLAVDPLALALDCQAAERAAGVHVGLLDPLAIAGARERHALHIDFESLDTRHVPVPEEAAFVIVHSEVPRILATSPYATRRAECERAARILGRPLGRCTLGDLSELPDPVLRRRARHVVTECDRVREAERLLGLGDLAGLGDVMTEGHRSLSGDYKVSVPAVEELVEQLLAQEGVLGARMTGGGFGGCVIALCRPDSPALDPAVHHPRRAWRVSPSAGATLLGT